jgi:hypothetical protein
MLVWFLDENPGTIREPQYPTPSSNNTAARMIAAPAPMIGREPVALVPELSVEGGIGGDVIFQYTRRGASPD